MLTSADWLMIFKHLEANITNNKNLKEKMQVQTTKTAMLLMRYNIDKLSI
jgi:hypothetical protein